MTSLSTEVQVTKQMRMMSGLIKAQSKPCKCGIISFNLNTSKYILSTMLVDNMGDEEESTRLVVYSPLNSIKLSFLC